MRTVLLTGRIGAGKTQVAVLLQQMGYPVYNSDNRTKALYSSVPGLKERIEEVTGLPFERLAEVFSDDKKRVALETLVYPLVLEDFLGWSRQQEENGCRVVFMESAIAHQKEQFRNLYDSVLLVRADADVRVLRNPKAQGRDALQTEPQNPDWVIENNGSLEELEQKVKKFIEKI